MQKSSYKRSTRLAETLKQEISLVLLQNAKDPRLQSLFIRRVEVTDDLRNARIYFSFGYGVTKPKEELQSVLKGLEKAKGFFRKKIAENIELRVVPDLDFFFDTSLEEKDRMESLFEQIAQTHPTASDDESNPSS